MKLRYVEDDTYLLIEMEEPNKLRIFRKDEKPLQESEIDNALDLINPYIANITWETCEVGEVTLANIEDVEVFKRSLVVTIMKQKKRVKRTKKGPKGLGNYIKKLVKRMGGIG